MSAILEGIRVLDFGRYVAGPYCATLLGYLGAEVIRIEKRDGGEDRYIAPVGKEGEGGLFFQTSCNKLSFTLDPTTPDGREIVQRLVTTADVVVANLPEKALTAMGLDYETLKAQKPEIVLTTVSGFGSSGPDKNRGAFDGIGQALSGAMAMTGTPGKPAKAAAPYVDFCTAVLAAFGTLAALMHRQQTGEGQHVEATLLGTSLSVFASHLVEQGVAGLNREGTGNRVQTSAPSDVFQTSDGRHLLIHTVGNNLFRRWTNLVGEPGWAGDRRFATDQSRGDHRDVLCERMAEWCAVRDQAQALEELGRAGVPAGPVLTLQEALDNPQAAAMEFFKMVDYPGLPRPAPVPDLPLKFSATTGGIDRRPPRLSEHTEQILKDLGYDAAGIATLKVKNVI